MSRVFKLLTAMALAALLLGGSVVLLSDPVERVRAYTRQIEFDYVDWTLGALWSKWQQLSVGSGEYVPVEDQSQVVLDYLELVRQIGAAQNEVARIYADPDIVDPEAASVDLRSQIEDLQAQRDQLGPLAESVFQAQLSAVLAEMGISLGGQPVPPVLYHITPPPNALIVSPRDAIRQDANISIDPDMTLDEITALEDQVADNLDVSTLVVGIGGIGLYPTMVMQTTDLNWLAEVVAHEWVHNFLTLRPLGASYLSSPELRTMNETVASIAGKEIGRQLVATYYPELLPPEPEPEQDQGQQPNPQETPAEPPAFDFRAEMHTTRLEVDRLLAEGKIPQAEAYMEVRRRMFWDQGYRLRKLNQAYFAFYGAYADQPGGAAGVDPVGTAVRALREQSASLTQFLNRVSWMWSFAQLQRAVAPAGEPDPAG
ncbi:MAG: hypothetical protein ACK2UW_17320 [Anaerolineales bacterium]